MKRGEIALGHAAVEMSIGSLSPDEQRLIPEQVAVDELRGRLRGEFATANQARDNALERLRAELPPNFPFDLVDAYSDARARVVIVREKFERLFGERP